MKIQEFSIARLRVEEDFGFQKRIEAETALLTLETDKPMVAAYKAALTAFDAALKGSISNSQSAAAIAADEQADAAWSTLVERVNALVLINDEDAYATFINRANVIIDQAWATLAARSTQAAKQQRQQ